MYKIKDLADPNYSNLILFPWSVYVIKMSEFLLFWFFILNPFITNSKEEIFQDSSCSWLKQLERIYCIAQLTHNILWHELP